MRPVSTAKLVLAGALLAACALVAGCGLDAAASALTSAGASSAPASPSPTVPPTVSPEPTSTPTETPPPTSTPSPTPTTTPAPTSSPSLSPTPTPSPTPTFRAKVARVSPALRERMINVGSWRSACPVRIRFLRVLTLTYWGFDDKPHTGRLMVARQVAWPVVRVFHTLFDKGFHIRRMRLIENYGADDHRSMAADNTSAFNGRYVSGTTRWSMHAYGIAIDINPVENPYVSDSYVSPPAGRTYADRSIYRRGMIHARDKVVRAFAAIGWTWGGSWRPARDYQHFSANGR